MGRGMPCMSTEQSDLFISKILTGDIVGETMTPELKHAHRRATGPAQLCRIPSASNPSQNSARINVILKLPSTLSLPGARTYYRGTQIAMQKDFFFNQGDIVGETMTPELRPTITDKRPSSTAPQIPSASNPRTA